MSPVSRTPEMVASRFHSTPRPANTYGYRYPLYTEQEEDGCTDAACVDRP
jgi:hypothetical protein